MAVTVVRLVVHAGGFGRSGPPVMILDELDSGVGARLGTPIARLLSQMASAKHAGLTSQILCVSHLPQVCNLSTWRSMTL